jgi:hypothetical protein
MVPANLVRSAGSGRRRPNCRSVELTFDTRVVAVLWQRPLVQSRESMAVSPFPLIRKHIFHEPHRTHGTLDFGDLPLSIRVYGESLDSISRRGLMGEEKPNDYAAANGFPM